MLELLAPLGAAIAWVWHEITKHKKEKALQAISEADRERSYSERIEARLKAREQELEKVLVELMDLKLTHAEPEEVLKSIIESDSGISWATKDGVLVAKSPHYKDSVGRTFFWSGYTVGIGYD